MIMNDIKYFIHRVNLYFGFFVIDCGLYFPSAISKAE